MMFSAYILLLLNIFSLQCEDIQLLREDFHKLNSEERLEKFINQYASINCNDAKPYIASAIMQQAQYTSWPNKKIQFFKNGKTQLEAFIKANPKSIEGHYVRFLVQTSIPKFLGYNSEIENDKAFIEANLSHSALPEAYKKTIQNTLKAIAQ